MKHYDKYIPLPGYSGALDEENTSSELNALLSKVGAKYGEKAVEILDWTREKVMKWTGMGVTEFADLLGIPRFVDWSHLTDAKELLKEAAILGHEGTVSMLLEKRGKIKGDDQLRPDVTEAFHYSCFHGNEWVVRLFSDHVLSVDVADDDGKTGLHKAARQGHERVAAALLEFGADLNKQDVWGSTPMDEALRGNHNSIVRLFMRHRGALVASSKPAADASLATFRPTEKPKLDRFIGMNATIVDFYVDRSDEGDDLEEHRVERTAVETLLWGDRLGSDTSSENSSSEEYPEPDFKWIHLPANNVSSTLDISPCSTSLVADSLRWLGSK